MTSKPKKTEAMAGVPLRCDCGRSFFASGGRPGGFFRCPACGEPIVVPGELIDDVGEKARAELDLPLGIEWLRPKPGLSEPANDGGYGALIAGGTPFAGCLYTIRWLLRSLATTAPIPSS